MFCPFPQVACSARVLKCVLPYNVVDTEEGVWHLGAQAVAVAADTAGQRGSQSSPYGATRMGGMSGQWPTP